MVDFMVVNVQIIDVVIQINVKVVVEVLVQVIVVFYQIVSYFVGLFLQNVVYSQQVLNQIFIVVVFKVVLMIMVIEDKKGI